MPTITVITNAPTRPPISIEMMIAISPPSITMVPSAPSPAMPAEVGFRQFPYVRARGADSVAATWSLRRVVAA